MVRALKDFEVCDGQQKTPRQHADCLQVGIPPDGNYMVGRPPWLTWEREHFSIPNAFDGNMEGWTLTVDWILSGAHRLPDQLGHVSIHATNLWILAAGLMYRDIVENLKRRHACIDSAERVGIWDSERSQIFWNLVDETTYMLQNNQRKESPSDYDAVLMTQEELLDGIITPPLCEVPPSKAVTHLLYLERLLVRPALVKFQSDLKRFKVRQSLSLL